MAHNEMNNMEIRLAQFKDQEKAQNVYNSQNGAFHK